MNTVQPDLYFSVPIDGYQDEPDGSVTVYGIPCKPDTLDVDGQRVDPSWLKTALNRWYQTGPNIREMHQPSAVGVGTDLEWDGDTPLLTGKIVDPVAVKKVKSKVYRAFSIGVKNHVLKMNDPDAPKGRIVGGDIVETSVVDRPAIPGSDILDFKGDLFKIASAVGPDEVLDHQQGVVWQRVGHVALPRQGDDMSAKSAEPDLAKAGKPVGLTDAIKRRYAADLKNKQKNPDSDLASACRRLSQWAASGSLPTGLSYEDAKWMYNQAAAELKRRNKDSEAGGNFPALGSGKAAHEDGVEKCQALTNALGDAASDSQGNDTRESATPDKEEKVAESTDKTAVEEAAKTVDAATDVKAADGDEKTPDADDGKDAAAETVKSPILAELEEKAARSAFCVDCGKSVEIEHGKQVEQSGNTFLVGKDAAGHELRKFVPAAEVEKRDPVPTDDADDDECDMPDDGKAAKKEEPAVPEVHVHLHEDEPDGDEEEDGKVAKVAAPASSDVQDLVKAAVVAALADAGIDLGKIGRRMAKSRLDRMAAAIDELKSLAAELGDAPEDAAKAAQAGSDAITRMEACLAEIGSLARQMANPGAATEDGEDGDVDMGTAGTLSPTTLPLKRAADPDLTKTPAANAQETAEVLAKAVAAELEKVTKPLVERLAQVEYTLKPASPPVLHAEERPNAFVGKQADARRMAVDTAIGELTTKLSDADREKLAAAVLAGDSTWQR